MNEEDDEVEGSIRSLPTKKIKISIHCHFMILFCYAFVYIHDRMFALMTVYY